MRPKYTQLALQQCHDLFSPKLQRRQKLRVTVALAPRLSASRAAATLQSLPRAKFGWRGRLWAVVCSTICNFLNLGCDCCSTVLASFVVRAVVVPTFCNRNFKQRWHGQVNSSDKNNQNVIKRCAPIASAAAAYTDLGGFFWMSVRIGIDILEKELE